MSRQIVYSLSEAWAEKEPADPTASVQWLWSASFVPVKTDLYGLYENVVHGFKFSPCAFQKGTKREDTFVSSDLLALDYDGGNHSLEAMRAHPMLSKATLIYPTPSWTEADKRWRVVFVLPETITDVQTWRFAAAGLFLRCAEIGGLDKASRVPSQCYAGSYKAAEFHYFAPDAELTQSAVEYLIMLGTPPPPPLVGQLVHSAKWTEYIKLIEAELQRRGVKRYNAAGWSNAIQCPFKDHQHDNRAPATSWNNKTHCLTCHKCQQTWNALDAGRALGVEYGR
jgi:hypothetical protein